MVYINKILMVAIFAITLVALGGVASAVGIPDYNPLPGLTVTADTVQTNGHYIGVPTLINGETYTYGYNYTLVPDGTYTVTGTVKNELNRNMTVAIILCNQSLFGPGSVEDENIPEMALVDVPAAGSKPASVGFSITTPEGMIGNPDDIAGFYITSGIEEEFPVAADEGETYFGPVDFNDADYVDAPQGIHTIDEGPMSNMAVIFNSNLVNSNASVMYTLNQSGDDYKALYTNGKMDFKSSPLYAFAE